MERTSAVIIGIIQGMKEHPHSWAYVLTHEHEERLENQSVAPKGYYRDENTLWFDHVTHRQLEYHLRLMVDEGLLAINRLPRGGQTRYELMPEGHDYKEF